MVFEDGALTLKQLFEGMIACEKEVAEFYDLLSHKFADYEELSAFWMQMRDHEFNHAGTLQNIAGDINAEQLSAPVEESVRQKLASVHRLLDEAMESSVTTLWDAYEMAHRIETSELKAIFTFLVFETVSSEERMHLVKRQVDEHIGKLDDFGRRYKRNFDMKAILAKGVRKKNG